MDVLAYHTPRRLHATLKPHQPFFYKFLLNFQHNFIVHHSY